MRRSWRGRLDRGGLPALSPSWPCDETWSVTFRPPGCAGARHVATEDVTQARGAPPLPDLACAPSPRPKRSVIAPGAGGKCVPNTVIVWGADEGEAEGVTRRSVAGVKRWMCTPDREKETPLYDTWGLGFGVWGLGFGV